MNTEKMVVSQCEKVGVMSLTRARWNICEQKAEELTSQYTAPLYL